MSKRPVKPTLQNPLDPPEKVDFNIPGEIARATGNMDEFGNSVGAANAEVGIGPMTPGGGRSTAGPAGSTTITINYAPSTQIEGAGNEQTVLQFVTEGLRNNADGLRSLVEGLARGAV